MMASHLPRPVYWVLGAVIALTGAIAARLIGDHVGDVYRVPVWLTGAAVIFVGLAVVSLGTRSRLESADEAENGAGEGNRTLA